MIFRGEGRRLNTWTDVARPFFECGYEKSAGRFETAMARLRTRVGKSLFENSYWTNHAAPHQTLFRHIRAGFYLHGMARKEMR